MKNRAAAFVCLALTMPLVMKAQAPNITGTWIGQITEPGGPIQAMSFPLEMDLVENPDGSVTGTTTSSAQINGAQYSALFILGGQVTNGVFAFQDLLLSSTSAPPGTAWCMDSGELTFSSGSNSSTLTGPWQALHCPGGTITLTRTVSLQSTGSVLNGASFQPGIVPSSWITIQGTNLSDTTDTWDKSIVKGNLPTTLDGVSVSIGGNPAYIEYVSPVQINAVAPDVGTGQVSVIVTNPNGASAPVSVMSQAVSPAFFLWAGKYSVATRQDFSWAVKDGTFQGITTTPAKPDDVIILWGTGFGPTDPVAPVGVETPADKTYETSNLVAVTVGDAPAKVYGTALAPGFAGLYQVAIQIPASAPDGDLPVVATIRGVQSPGSTLITVQSAN